MTETVQSSKFKVQGSFDPVNQIDQGFEALGIAFIEARAILGRLEWAKDKLIAEIDTAREERDRLEIYDEHEAAVMLRIEDKHLGDLRRRHKFAHCKLGSKVLYTRQHLTAVIDFFEVRERKAALRNAA